MIYLRDELCPEAKVPPQSDELTTLCRMEIKDVNGLGRPSTVTLAFLYPWPGVAQLLLLCLPRDERHVRVPRQPPAKQPSRRKVKQGADEYYEAVFGLV